MPENSQPALEWPIGTSRMHARIRAYDWAATPLGPISNWLPCLKHAVDIMLGTQFPTLLLWGRDLIQFSNDAYFAQCTKGAPIGAGFAEVWPDAWPFNAPIIEQVWNGESIVVDETPFHRWQPGTADDDWYTLSYSPVRDEVGEVAGIWITVIETTKRVRAETTLRESEARLVQLLELLPAGVALFNSDGLVVDSNPEMMRLLADHYAPGLRGKSDTTQLLSDSSGRQLERHEYPAARALRGEVVKPGVEVLFENKDDRRWLKIGAVPLMRDGKIFGSLTVAHDITEARMNADRLKVLVAELQHRTRNLITIVRALAETTIDGSASLAEFREKYRARLAALARVQGLLSQLESARVTFDALLRAELAAHAALDKDQVTLDGPMGVRLHPSTVQTLALALHELATNATKYGALSQAKSRLEIKWRVNLADEPSDSILHVSWREADVAMPQTTSIASGFGRELIERALPYQLNAVTTYELGKDGVSCTITLPLEGDGAE